MDPIILAALISLIATEAAGLIAAVGLLVTRKPSIENTSGSRPVEFWEVRFREIHEAVIDNRDELREIKWVLQTRTQEFRDIHNALRDQGKALGEVANAIQQMRGVNWRQK